ncbi:MAG: phosphoribosylformylglycinamidine cyclo-ligase [Candidatus Latescibacteria bacterium]|nr:phosphoribosylformylglycinamidine cyclo-ligase [Candidatus Latescibacterota bacterium]
MNKPVIARAYQKSGVDISQTTKIKSDIKSLVKKTFTPQVLSQIGLFGGLYELKRSADSGKQKVVLVASCDGVGTKLNIASMMNKHDTVGEDLVNHCVNDSLTLGARPLFFLDYIAYTKVKSGVIEQVITGLAKGCKNNECALIGGETAMMPDMYKPNEYDLAGFIVGIVDKDKIIDGKEISVGDKLIGIPSSGLHTNGYSLARKIFFKDNKFTVNSRLPGLKTTLGQALLQTHKSYFKQVYPLLPYVSGIAHITGGGFYENVERLLPKNLSCIINKSTWQVPPIFKIMQKYGKVSEPEMYKVFNMGIGMVLFARPKNVDKILKYVFKSIVIGEVRQGNWGMRIEN